MDEYVAQANIDHYTGLLNRSDLAPRNRDTIVKLLISEEDKLGHDLEQLEFAERRAAESRNRLNFARNLRNSFIEGSSERADADRVLQNFEAIHRLFEQFRNCLRERVHSRAI
jgi:hypothetical protein